MNLKQIKNATALSRQITVNGLAVWVWAVRHIDGWGWVSDLHGNPFAAPTTGGAVMAQIPTGSYATSDAAIAAAAAALQHPAPLAGAHKIQPK